MIRVIDDLIEPHHYTDLRENMRNFSFPWSRRNNSLTAESQLDISLFPEDHEWVAFREENTVEHEVFDYYFRPDLPSHQLIIPVADEICSEYSEETLFNRMTAHLLPVAKEGYNIAPRVDIKEPEYKWKTGLFFLNDNISVTVYENLWNGEDPRPLKVEELVQAREGRLLIFDSTHYYSIEGPTDESSMFIKMVFSEYDNLPDWMNGRDMVEGYVLKDEDEFYEED